MTKNRVLCFTKNIQKIPPKDQHSLTKRGEAETHLVNTATTTTRSGKTEHARISHTHTQQRLRRTTERSDGHTVHRLDFVHQLNFEATKFGAGTLQNITTHTHIHARIRASARAQRTSVRSARTPRNPERRCVRARSCVCATASACMCVRE